MTDRDRPWPFVMPIFPAEHAMVLHGAARHGRVTVAVSNGRHGWKERSIPAEDLDYALSDLVGWHDLYFSMNRFRTKRRRVACLAELGALFADLDYYKTAFADRGPREIVDLAVVTLEHAGMPLPSLAIYSGRGMALIWLHSPVPPAALPRWRRCQQRLHDALRPYGADPLATDAARVLRIIGSINSRSGAFVVAIEPPTPPRPFDELADQITAQIIDLETERPRRATARHTPVRAGLVRRCNFNAATLWQGRCAELDALLKHRWLGALPAGHRDAWAFFSSVGISYLVPSTVLRRELCEIASQATAGAWSESETHQRLQAVLHRAAQAARGERVDWAGRSFDPRYRFRDETIIRALDISEAEMRDLGFRHLVTHEMKREQARARLTNWRRQQGVTARDDYLAGSTQRQKPWEAEGISRATWYRRRS
jgi:hypothetical protein